MKNIKRYIIALSFIIAACGKDGNISPESQPYVFEVPAAFPQPVFDTENPMTEQGIELGRMLFYDVRLSGNNKISCASCHEPRLAFSDGFALSKAGVSGTTLHRHAPALINLAWAGNGLFWDGGSTNLESQAFGPLTAVDEMQQDLTELNKELNVIPDYVSRFRTVFNEEISSANVVRALAQFQRSLVSANSRYDRFKREELSGQTLSADELEGFALVRQKCQGCHSGELFTDNDYHNNGIDSDFRSEVLEGIYQGRSRITYDPSDLGKFKTPTLRNVGLTAPFMHDGRFATLEEVLDQYSEGIKNSPTLDTRLSAGGFKLTSQQKRQIIAFLHTLTDYEFISSKKIQKP